MSREGVKTLMVALVCIALAWAETRHYIRAVCEAAALLTK